MIERVNEKERKTTTIFLCGIVWELILVLINYGPRIIPAGDHNIGDSSNSKIFFLKVNLLQT